MYLQLRIIMYISHFVSSTILFWTTNRILPIALCNLSNLIAQLPLCGQRMRREGNIVNIARGNHNVQNISFRLWCVIGSYNKASKLCRAIYIINEMFYHFCAICWIIIAVYRWKQVGQKQPVLFLQVTLNYYITPKIYRN